MNNNDILIRIRYALNLKDGQMVKIFKLGGVEVTEEEVKKMLTKVKEEFGFQDADSNETLPCNNKMLDAFLNGLITFKRGPQEKKSGQPENPVSITRRNNINNIVLKKLKIHLSRNNLQILQILKCIYIQLLKKFGVILTVK